MTPLPVPDAIFIPSGGTIADPVTGIYRSTTYEEGDGSGTLGGYARIQAAAILAQHYPDAVLLPQGGTLLGPAHAETMRRELVELGVPEERIELEMNIGNTRQQVATALEVATERGWKQVLIVSNEYHLPRIRSFVEHAPQRPSFDVEYVAAEAILAENDPTFAEEFAALKERPAYQLRLDAEARGLAAIESGTYNPLPPEAKQERPE